MPKLKTLNPTTGELLAELDLTDPSSLPQVLERARSAQRLWASYPLKLRAKKLRTLREVLLDQVSEVAELISRENGKPAFEALSNELFPSIESLTFFAARAPRALSDKRIPLHLMRHRSSTLQYWPLGVVAVISPWNFPFLLPFAEIIMALVAGNAVVFKPSEATPLVGLKIQELVDSAGFPEGLMQTVIGDGTLGAALVRAKPDKIFFTGSVPTGKRIATAAAETLTPVNLELGGKNAMIVLPDADLDFASSAILWGSFGNSGQVCAAISRVIAHESIIDRLTEALRAKVERLSSTSSFGSITMEKQKEVYRSQLEEARNSGVKILTGGEFSSDGTRFLPTILTGAGLEKLRVFREESFGPIVSLVPYRATADAVRKANESPYGLVASIVTRNLPLADEIARQLEAGTVMINEVTYTAGLPETPWGGVKESGMGRTHSEQGLLEFVNVRHVHRPAASFLTFKSPWWFPYTPFQTALFRHALELYRASWLSRLRALPHVLWNFAQFVKREPRL